MYRMYVIVSISGILAVPRSHSLRSSFHACPSPLNTGQVCLGSKVSGVEFVESRKSRVESVMSRLNVSCVV